MRRGRVRAMRVSGALQELGDGVFAWLQSPAEHGAPNAGVIVEDDALTVVDTLLNPLQAEPFVDALERFGRPIRRAVYTSSHVEYVGGSSRFWMAARYGRAQTHALLDQPASPPTYRMMFPDHADEFDDEFTTRPVSHAVDEAAWLSTRVLVVPVGGQQLENLVVQVPDAGVLFAGALGAFGVTPNAFDGNPEAWADQLADLAGWGTTIVPGVGALGGPDDVIALQAYLYAVVEAEGEVSAIPSGPWDNWTDRDLDEVNVERAALLAVDDYQVPPTMLARLGLS